MELVGTESEKGPCRSNTVVSVFQRSGERERRSGSGSGSGSESLAYPAGDRTAVWQNKLHLP